MQRDQAGDTPNDASHWDREDDRWVRVASRRRDWMILLTMVVIYLVWTGIIFMFEPGIR